MTITKELIAEVIQASQGFIDSEKCTAGKADLQLWLDVVYPELTLEMARMLLAGMEQEPVGDVVSWSRPGEERTCDIRWRRFDVAPGPLYAAPQSAPVVPDEIEPDDGNTFDYVDGWSACRAAMLQGAARPQNALQNIPENNPATQFKPVVQERTHFKQVADLYEMQFDDGRTMAYHTDAGKAVQWLNTCDGNKVQEYVKLERYQAAMLQAGNSPGIPDGWINCSERMPEVGEYVLCLDNGEKYQNCIPDHDDIYTASYCDRLGSFTTEYWGDHDWMSKRNPTHWAPLPDMPAAPQQEKTSTASNIDKR